MNENYIVINGKKIELTEEQIKTLNLDIELERRNPFTRFNDKYYYIEETGEICMYYDSQDPLDKILYNNVNYFNDEAFAKQVALHQLLYRKLLKFAYDNGFEDKAKWELYNRHCRIYYNHINNDFAIIEDTSAQNQCVYFSTGVGAKRAIEEVVEPFMKEHPEFVW